MAVAEAEAEAAAAAAPVEEEEAHTETSYLLLSLFPSFPSPTAAANGRRCLLSPFSSSFTSSLARIPSPGCNSGGLSAPRTAVYFYCDVLPPPPHSLLLAPYSHLPPFPATSTTAPRARLLFIRVAPAFFFLSSFLSSFLSAPHLALPVVSNFAKGWRRECAPRPSHGGVFFLHQLAFLLRPVLRIFFFASFPSRRSYFSRTRAAVSR